jgi:hypothetical protein
MILKGFGFVAFFAGVKASSYLSIFLFPIFQYFFSIRTDTTVGCAVQKHWEQSMKLATLLSFIKNWVHPIASVVL